MKLSTNQKLVAETKNKLQLPKATLSVMSSGEKVPQETIKDSLMALDEVVDLVNKIADWS